ncbi:MAG: IPT/TIG domain-containing protein, partial [Planctomycetota bacterium]
MIPSRRTRLCAGILTILLASTAIAQPATLTQSVTHNGETITLQLTKVDLRGPNFELWEQNPTGGYDVVTPVAERSYLGTVAEDPAAVSCGVLLDNGQFKGTVYFDRGLTWFTLEDSVTDTRGVTHAVDVFTDFQLPTAPTVAPGSSGTDTHQFDVGVDGSYDYYVDRGSSVAGCLEMIEYSVNNTRAIYVRDSLLRPALGRVIIRADATQDPYGGFMELDPLRAHWQANQTSANRDVVCGVQPAFGGGLAWVSQVGTSFAYSINGSSGGAFDVVWRHEVGHNWGCGHFVGDNPEGAGLMGGNQPGRLSGCEVHRVLEYRDNRIAAGGILTNDGVFTEVDLPPYAALDVPPFDVTEGETVTLDVLANDFDANGHPISLLSFDANSSLGGAVQLSAGTGPAGRDELIYTSPPTSGGLDDYVLYQIQDSSGQTATGALIVRSLDAPPLPTIDAVSPDLGPTTGGTPVTITGTNFAPDVTVTFDSNEIDNFTFVDSNTIAGTTPAMASASTVDVSVSSPFGSNVLFDAFTFTDNHFGILSASGVPGGNATIAALLSHDEDLEGYSLGAIYESSFLNVTEVT